MITATRRPSPLLVSGLATWLVAAAGCTLPFGGTDRAAPREAAAPAGSLNREPAPPPAYVAPAHRPVGRVLYPDPEGGVAVVELSPFVRPALIADLKGRELIARNPDTLEKTATLIASGRRDGAILGVYVKEGMPAPGDEVALPPAF